MWIAQSFTKVSEPYKESINNESESLKELFNTVSESQLLSDSLTLENNFLMVSVG